MTPYPDEVSEPSGEIFLIPGSHGYGVIEPRVREKGSGGGGMTGAARAPDVAADLTCSSGRETVGPLAQRHGLATSRGPAGRMPIFHPDLVHGSCPGLSPFGRSLPGVARNRIHDPPVPVPGAAPRPGFLRSRDPAPLAPLAEAVREPAAA